jgi:hypothetical protein
LRAKWKEALGNVLWHFQFEVPEKLYAKPLILVEERGIVVRAPDGARRGAGRIAMATIKPRTNHQTRINWWRTTVRRQREGKLSATEYCPRLGVAVSTLYHWSNRIHELLPDALGQFPGARRSRHAAAAANFVSLSIIEPGAGSELETELANRCVLEFKGVVHPLLLKAARRRSGNSTAPTKEPTDLSSTLRRRARLR